MGQAKLEFPKGWRGVNQITFCRGGGGRGEGRGYGYFQSLPGFGSTMNEKAEC